MSGRVISFRMDDDVFAELEQRILSGESPGQAANRILKSALGFADATEVGDIRKLIAEELAPILVRLNSLEFNLNELKSMKGRSTNHKNNPKLKTSRAGEIQSIGFLKNRRIFDKKVKPSEQDIGIIFDGLDGSKWEYLGYQKSNTSGLPQKQFRRIN